jgi:hypothetical protein
MMKKATRRGRVKGRPLAKQTPEVAEQSSWFDLLVRARYGEIGYGIYKMVQECFRLGRKREELNLLKQQLVYECELNAVVKWMRKLYGKNWRGHGFVAADMVRAGRNDRSRDEEVYRYYVKEADLVNEEEQMDKWLGGFVRRCIQTVDTKSLHGLTKAVEGFGIPPYDKKREKYLRTIGEDKEGKIYRNQPVAVTRNWLCKVTGLHGWEIDRFNDEFGVVLHKGSPGRHKKYPPNKF